METDVASVPEAPEEDAEFLRLSVPTQGVTLRLSPPLDTSAQQGNLLAVSNVFGWSVAARNEGFCLFSIASLRDQFSTSPPHSTPDAIPKLAVPTPAKVDVIRFAVGDQVVLAAMRDASVGVWRLKSLVEGNTDPTFIFPSISSSPVYDLLPNPAPSSPLVIATTQSGAALLNIETHSVTIPFPANLQATAACWSVKGKQVALGTSNGTIGQFTPDGTLKAEIPLPLFLSPQAPWQVKNLYWLENTVFLVTYAHPAAPGEAPNNEQEIVVVTTPAKDQTSTKFVKVFEPTPAFGMMNMDARRWTAKFRSWEPFDHLVFLASAPSMDVGTLAKLNSGWATLSLDEASRPQIPSTSAGEDATPLGLEIDLTGPTPVLMAYTSEGVLIAWNVANEKGGAFTGLRKAHDVVTEENAAERLEMSASTATQPMVTSSPFGAPPSTSPFTTVSTSSPFGAPAFGATPSFGSSTFGASTFGSKSATPTPASKSSTNVFSASSSGGFAGFGVASGGFAAAAASGSPSDRDASPFGSGGQFGKTPAFSSAPTPAFGSTGFGSTPSAPSTGGFAGFGSVTTTSTSSGFGAFAGQPGASPFSSSGASPFGSTSKPAKSIFDSPTETSSTSVPTSAFGSSGFAKFQPSSVSAKPTSAFGSGRMSENSDSEPEEEMADEDEPKRVDEPPDLEPTQTGLDIADSMRDAVSSTTRFPSASSASTALPSNDKARPLDLGGFGGLGFGKSSENDTPASSTPAPSIFGNTAPVTVKTPPAVNFGYGSAIKPETGFSFGQAVSSSTPSVPAASTPSTANGFAAFALPASSEPKTPEQPKPAFSFATPPSKSLAAPSTVSSLSAQNGKPILGKEVKDTPLPPETPPLASPTSPVSSETKEDEGITPVKPGDKPLSSTKAFFGFSSSPPSNSGASLLSRLSAPEIANGNSDEAEEVDENEAEVEEPEEEEEGEEDYDENEDEDDYEESEEEGEEEVGQQEASNVEEVEEVPLVPTAEPKSTSAVQGSPSSQPKSTTTQSPFGVFGSQPTQASPSLDSAEPSAFSFGTQPSTPPPTVSSTTTPASKTASTPLDGLGGARKPFSFTNMSAPKTSSPLAGPSMIASPPPAAKQLPATQPSRWTPTQAPSVEKLSPASSPSPFSFLAPPSQEKAAPAISTSTPSFAAGAFQGFKPSTPQSTVSFDPAATRNKPTPAAATSSPSSPSSATLPTKALQKNLAPSLQDRSAPKIGEKMTAQTPTAPPGVSGLAGEFLKAYLVLQAEFDLLRKNTAICKSFVNDIGQEYRTPDLTLSFDDRQWSLGDLSELKKVTEDLSPSIKKLVELASATKREVSALQSQILKAETKKEEAARFIRARSDPVFAKMVRVRQLGPEQIESQKRIRLSVDAVRSRLVQIEEHMAALKNKITEEKLGRSSFRAPSLDAVNRAVRNITVAVTDRALELDELALRLDVLRIDPFSPLASRHQQHRSSSIDDALSTSSLRGSPISGNRALVASMHPNVTASAKGALAAERTSSILKAAVLSVRTQPLLNTQARSRNVAERDLADLQTIFASGPITGDRLPRPRRPVKPVKPPVEASFPSIAPSPPTSSSAFGAPVTPSWALSTPTPAATAGSFPVFKAPTFIPFDSPATVPSSPPRGSEGWGRPQRSSSRRHVGAVPLKTSTSPTTMTEEAGASTNGASPSTPSKSTFDWGVPALPTFAPRNVGNFIKLTGGSGGGTTTPTTSPVSSPFKPPIAVPSRREDVSEEGAGSDEDDQSWEEDDIDEEEEEDDDEEEEGLDTIDEADEE